MNWLTAPDRSLFESITPLIVFKQPAKHEPRKLIEGKKDGKCDVKNIHKQAMKSCYGNIQIVLRIPRSKFSCFRALKFIHWSSATVEREKINETIVNTCVFEFLMTATYLNAREGEKFMIILGKRHDNAQLLLHWGVTDLKK